MVTCRFYVLCVHFSGVMGRRKFRLGRLRKNAEKQRQMDGKNKPGRPRKRSKGTSPEPTLEPRESTSQVVPVTLELLRNSLGKLTTPQSWSSHYSESDKQLKLCKFNSLPSTSSQPLVVTHTVCVQEDLTWSVFVHRSKIHRIVDTPLSCIPSILNPQTLHKLISVLDTARVCPGNPEEHFIPLAEAHKGEFKTSSGQVKARVEKGFVSKLMAMCTYKPSVQHHAVCLSDKEHAVPADHIVLNSDLCTVGSQKSQQLQRSMPTTAT